MVLEFIKCKLQLSLTKNSINRLPDTPGSVLARFTAYGAICQNISVQAKKNSFRCDIVTIWIQLVTKCIHFALTELHRTQKCFGITLIILIENELEAFPIKIYWMKPLLIIRVIDLESGWDGVLSWMGDNTDRK